MKELSLPISFRPIAIIVFLLTNAIKPATTIDALCLNFKMALDLSKKDCDRSMLDIMFSGTLTRVEVNALKEVKVFRINPHTTTWGPYGPQSVSFRCSIYITRDQTMLLWICYRDT